MIVGCDNPSRRKVLGALCGSCTALFAFSPDKLLYNDGRNKPPTHVLKGRKHQKIGKKISFNDEEYVKAYSTIYPNDEATADAVIAGLVHTKKAQAKGNRAYQARAKGEGTLHVPVPLLWITPSSSALHAHASHYSANAPERKFHKLDGIRSRNGWALCCCSESCELFAAAGIPGFLNISCALKHESVVSWDEPGGNYAVCEFVVEVSDCQVFHLLLYLKIWIKTFSTEKEGKREVLAPRLFSQSHPMDNSGFMMPTTGRLYCWPTLILGKTWWVFDLQSTRSNQH